MHPPALLVHSEDIYKIEIEKIHYVTINWKIVKYVTSTRTKTRLANPDAHNVLLTDHQLMTLKQLKSMTVKTIARQEEQSATTEKDVTKMMIVKSVFLVLLPTMKTSHQAEKRANSVPLDFLTHRRQQKSALPVLKVPAFVQYQDQRWVPR
jgi:isocitrate dehydrogenase kinase/phosphatase